MHITIKKKIKVRAPPTARRINGQFHAKSVSVPVNCIIRW